MPLGERELSAVTGVNVALSAVSLAASGVVVASYLACPRLRKFAFRLVFYLSCSELAYNAAMLLGHPRPASAACAVQAAALQYFSNAAVLWTSVIAFTLRRAVRHPRDLGHGRRERRYHLIAWGLPAVLTVLPAVSGSFGAAGAFCWIDASNTGQFWRFVAFYVPLWSCMTYNVYVYSTTMRVIMKALKRAGNRVGKSKMPLLLYPLILLVCWFWATVNRVQNWLQPEEPKLWLYLLGVSFSACQGLCHALAYSTNESVRRAQREWLCPGRAGAGPGSGASVSESTDNEDAEAMLPEGSESTEGGEDSEAGDVVGAAVGAAAGAPAEKHTQVERLRDVSHEIRAMYLQSLGIMELAGFHESRDAYDTLHEAHVASEADNASKKLPKSTVSATYFTMFKSFVGIGILTIPHAYMNAGYVGASIGLVVVSWLSYICMQRLIASHDALLVSAEPGATLTFSEIAGRAYGLIGARVVDFCLVSSQIGFSVAYLLFIGDNITHTFSQSSGGHMSKALVVSLAALFILPFTWLKSLKRLAPAALGADFVIVFGLIVVFCYDVGQTSKALPEVHVFRPSTFPLFFGVAVFAFEGIGMVIPIRNAMAQPKKFDSVLRNTMVSLTFLLIVFGSMSYVAFGDNTSDMITLNLPHNGLVALVQVLYCVGLLFTFPLMMFPAIQILESTSLYAACKLPVAVAGLKHAGFRTFVVFIVVIAALFTPHFGLFVNLIGAGSCTMLAFIIPVMLYVKTMKTLSKREIAVSAVILIVGFIGGGISFVQSFVALLTASAEEG